MTLRDVQDEKNGKMEEVLNTYKHYWIISLNKLQYSEQKNIYVKFWVYVSSPGYLGSSNLSMLTVRMCSRVTLWFRLYTFTNTPLEGAGMLLGNLFG